jgi:hypothetical protein
MHAWHEPFDRILALAWDRSVSITTPEMGQPFYIDYPSRGEAWWVKVEKTSETLANQRRSRQCNRQQAAGRG